ncbi:hypothetical protein H5410_061304 [Solanum commersonii]|uniref:Uncharacterized protein n=1 Tax=Solanum commersonii TaxID=4109 RepID=A0A9J5W7M4_SOLCO|nr:hypothetical protein H5410_061304 [Solanum commersonii]
MFQDVVLMDDERAVIEIENLNDLNDSSFNKLRETENITQPHSHTRKNEKELPYNPSHYVGVDLNLTSNEDFQKLAQEVVKAKGLLGANNGSRVSATYRV